MRINSTKSVSAHVASGVPERSVFGPSLFLLYINDLVNVINRPNSDVRFYADDAKLFREVVDLHDVHLLQADLDNLFKWAQTWQLNISVYKYFSLCISRNKHENLPVYSIDNIAVP